MLCYNIYVENETGGISTTFSAYRVQEYNIMSKKRNKKSHPSKKKKQKELSRYEKALGAIVSFFEKLKKNLKGLNFPSEFFAKNKMAIVFTVSMALIVSSGYFFLVHETPEEKSERINETVTVDLSDNEYLNVTDDIEQMVSSESSLDELLETEDLVNTEELPLVEMVNESLETTEVAVSDTEVLATEDQVTEPLQFLTTESSAYAPVSTSIMLGVDMYAILVNDEAVAYFETETEANDVLELLKDGFRSEEASEERIIFAEEVEVALVKRDIFDVEDCKTTEEVLELIVKGTNEQRIYTVVKGDNSWDIAHANDLRVDELEDANPQIDDISRLQIGDKLSLIVPEPIINVVTIATVERVDPIPYGRDPYEKTNQYFVGEYKTKRSGVEGEKDVVVEVYTKNGKIIGEKELSAEVIVEPINQVVWQGTKPAPPKIGTGTIDKPTSRGYITSGYGSRSLGWHNGIDIGLPMRSDVYAADGGVVIYADYKGTYGKVVIINHGANIETRYAHNDRLLVSAGEEVHQGQLIALSGNTGRSTGPHLHFEVRINGTPVNPTKYVRY